MKAETKQEPLVEFVDVSKLCRNWERAACEVSIHTGRGRDSKLDWLRMGECSLASRKDGHWELNARFADNVTDFEHDTGYVLCLPLIGVQFDDLFIHYSTANLIGWVDPSDSDRFRIPPPGYDPTKHPEAKRCKQYPGCKEGDPKGHIILPDGFWMPPKNVDLWRKVAGKKVEIRIGSVSPEP